MTPAVRTPEELDRAEALLREAIKGVRREIASLDRDRGGPRRRSFDAPVDGFRALHTELASLEAAIPLLDRERQLGSLQRELAELPCVRRASWVQEWSASGPRAVFAPDGVQLVLELADRSVHRIAVRYDVSAAALRESLMRLLKVDAGAAPAKEER